MSDKMIFYNDKSLQRGRRKHPRFKITRPVEFCEVYPELTSVSQGVTADMSRGGMLYITANFITPGSYIAFRIIQEKPRKNILTGVLHILRARKSEKHAEKFEIAGQLHCQFKNETGDDWNRLRQAAVDEMSQLLEVKKQEEEQEKKRRQNQRRKLQPPAFCPFCAAPVETEQLCAHCINRISHYFRLNRGEIFPLSGTHAQTEKPEKPGPKKIADNPDQITRETLELIKKLGSSLNPTALPFLEKALSNPNRQISTAARKAISQIKKAAG